MANLQHILAEYQPPWLPAKGELAGLVVRIDPAGGGSLDEASRRLDNLALLTGALLFHYVQVAGGVPLLSRADDRPASGEIEGGDIAISIQFADAEHPEPRVAATGKQDGDEVLARCLADSLGLAFAEQVETADLRGAGCGADVTLPAPGPDEDEKLVPRRSAEKLYCGLAAFASGRAKRESASVRDSFGGDQMNPSHSSGVQDCSHGCSESAEGGVAEPVVSRAKKPEPPRRDGGNFPQPRRRASTIGEERSESLAPILSRTQTSMPPRSPVPCFVDRSADEEMTQTARRIWPEGDLPLEKAAWFCTMFVRTALSDRSFVYIVPRVTVDGGTVVIEGATNVACMRDTLALALRAVGIERVESSMRVLPEEGRLDGERFGACVAATALTYEQPSESSGLRSQLLYGEPVRLLDRESGYRLVHSDDGYWGWVADNCVAVIPADQFDELLAKPRAAVRLHSTTVQPEALVDAVLEVLYRPYVFGGISPLGLDCSGLVRNVLAQCGVIAARDAEQQFMWGRLVATRWHRSGIRTGDILYFINPCGRIYHVGIAISSTHFVHAGVPEVKINSLDPTDRLYCPVRDKAFLAARRL